MTDHSITHFIVLFTAQKQKKFKTWQDGTMKYYSFNRKLVLVDEKGYSIDRTFYKGGVPSVGDEVEFEGHIVTIESLESTEVVNHNTVNHNTVSHNTVHHVPQQTTIPSSEERPRSTNVSRFKPPTMIPRKRIIKVDPEDEEEEDDDGDVDMTPRTTHSPAQEPPPTMKEAPTTKEPPSPAKASTTMQKRVRLGLSKRTTSALHQKLQNTTPSTSINPTSQPPHTSTPSTSFTKASDVNEDTTTVQPFKSPFAEGSAASLVLQFPNSKKALGYIRAKKYPKRTKVIPSKFKDIQVYKDTWKKAIFEHVDVLLLNYAMYFYSMYDKFGKSKTGSDLERIIRSKGMGLYCNVPFSQDHRRCRLRLRQKEHHSKYSKDDIWVISKSATFESSQTFLAKSTYFGPFSDGTLELECLSPRDVRIASQCETVYALRTIAASTELMMLDTVDTVEKVPILPYLLTPAKKKNTERPMMQRIELDVHDQVDIEQRLRDTIQHYHLNEDQSRVLRQVAASVISGPGWQHEQEQGDPIVLVHGVYGSGKSFLAAVIIIFLQELIDSVSSKREPEDQIQFKILVSSMTNVAVDRILQTLLKLGFDQFVRVGSMKKIAKNLLPYTAKARFSSNEELKELEQMLEEEQNSEQDIDYISTAIQHFRKASSKDQIHQVNVVGTTFMSSSFEIFDHVRFPFILVDESSQLMEPLTLVPFTRFSCQRLVMIGDPLQLPPTLGTNAEEGKVGMGLDKTLFDRCIEMGHESIMLRTQYRCHPRISNISNRLFYNRQLLNGVTDQDRKALIEGLPTVMLVDVGGSEQKAMRNGSYWNDAEIKISLDLLDMLQKHDISPSDIGVISLYKEQADRLSEQVMSSKKSIQISTVDAFQGGEKEIIILSTVRTSESSFMDNYPRINVALTRAKRHLIILGNRNMLNMNELWSKIIWDCQEHCFNSKSLATLLMHL